MRRTLVRCFTEKGFDVNLHVRHCTSPGHPLVTKVVGTVREQIPDQDSRSPGPTNVIVGQIRRNHPIWCLVLIKLQVGGWKGQRCAHVVGIYNCKRVSWDSRR
jgi:hypothetical protein